MNCFLVNLLVSFGAMLHKILTLVFAAVKLACIIESGGKHRVESLVRICMQVIKNKQDKEESE
jgi:hypothetical protein